MIAVKKFISIILVCAAVLLSGCSAEKENTPQTTTEPTTHTTTEAVLQTTTETTLQTTSETTSQATTELVTEICEALEFQNKIDIEETRKEFGTEKRILAKSKYGKCSISYPETKHEFLDEKIKAWVSDTMNIALNKFSDIDSENYLIETQVYYESYLVADRFAFIKENILISSTTDNYWANDVKLFQYDIRTGKEMVLSEIVREECFVELISLVAEKANIYSPDEGVIKHWLLKNEGLEIIVDWVYTSRADGFKGYLFKYDEIDYMLTDEFRALIGK